MPRLQKASHITFQGVFRSIEVDAAFEVTEADCFNLGGERVRDLAAFLLSSSSLIASVKKSKRLELETTNS